MLRDSNKTHTHTHIFADCAGQCGGTRAQGFFWGNFDRAMKYFFTVLAIRCLCLDAGPAVSLQDPTGQELIFLRLAINVAMAGPFALVENESLACVSGFKFVQTFWYVFAIFW